MSENEAERISRLIEGYKFPPMLGLDSWEAMYLRAKEDNRALHKGIKRLKNKEKELLERIEYLEAYNKSLVRTAIQNAYPNRIGEDVIEAAWKDLYARAGGTD